MIAITLPRGLIGHRGMPVVLHGGFGGADLEGGGKELNQPENWVPTAIPLYRTCPGAGGHRIKKISASKSAERRSPSVSLRNAGWNIWNMVLPFYRAFCAL